MLHGIFASKQKQIILNWEVVVNDSSNQDGIKRQTNMH
jgi:hypothetical protein